VKRAAPRLFALAGALLLGALILACNASDDPPPPTVTPIASTDPQLPPRTFQLGVSSLPVEATEEAYANAFTLAGQLGEVILIQRAPPWADFLPGGTVSPRTERLTRLERDLARSNGLQLLLAIDPTMPSNRGELAGLPPALSGRDFSDAGVRASFIAYAKYLALNYHPAYMALGVEVDLFYAQRGSAAFRNFISLYFEAYDAVKDVSPQTQVFTTFQYEDVLGVLARTRETQPAWSLIDQFQPKLDLVAVSTFPGAAYDQLGDIPGDYYGELAERFELPVAFISTGWPSRSDGVVSDTSQVAFLYRILAAADELKSPFLIWFLARDPEVAGDDGEGPLASMGFYDAFGRPKSVLRIWSSSLARPLQP
jgi:hypothetical protein